MSPLVLDLLIKGLESLPTLIDAGINVYGRIEQLQALAKGSKDGTITDADIAKIRSDFDADLDDFNQNIV